MPVYLDCAATAPLDPRVREIVGRYLDVEFGNAGSRTHEFGHRARSAVERARTQVAAAVAASRSEVVFTSGATESNNLAILGLAEHGLRTGRTHIVATEIEHHSVLEPLKHLKQRGFEITLVPVRPEGYVEAGNVLEAIRAETLLVTVMHANNETGVLQPVEQIAQLLEQSGRSAYFHVDAAQSFGKQTAALRNPRIDLISVSGHKIYAPKGIGALVARRRDGERPPLAPLMFGGGQELGLRPGTAPVALIAGLGEAAEIALAEADRRNAACEEFKQRMLEALRPLEVAINGDQTNCLPQIINLSIPGVDAETALEATGDIVAASTGAACTTVSKTCSHVLTAMGFSGDRLEGGLRFSWYHGTEQPDWEAFVAAVQRLRDGRPARPLAGQL